MLPALMTLLVLLTLLLSPQEATFHTTVPVVLVPATVTDRSGATIDGLNVDDFTLLEDGRPRIIQMDTSILRRPRYSRSGRSGA